MVVKNEPMLVCIDFKLAALSVVEYGAKGRCRLGGNNILGILSLQRQLRMQLQFATNPNCDWKPVRSKC